MIIARRVSLPYASFLTAWHALDLGEVPTALLPARVVPCRDDPAVITERAWDDLFERDLATGRQITDDFEGTLRRLATAATRFYAFFHEGDGDTRSALVAGSAVVATVDGGTVTLRPSWSDSGARALVDLLPEVPKPPGEPLSTPAGQLARASGQGTVTTVQPTGRAAVAARMRWVLSQPRTGGGQLYAARLDREGRRRVCVRPLSYIDIATGRFLAAEHEAGDGILWRSLIPVDAALLTRRVRELLPR